MNMFLLAGYDNTGPHIYSVDPVGGHSDKDKFYSTGSGAPFVYGVLEADFKENMTTEEGIKLALKSIKAAIGRDIASGGNGFMVAVMDKDGYREIPNQEIEKY